MDAIVGFEEFRWLRELSYKTPRGAVPESIGLRLLARGLIERKASGFSLTRRGLIALQKLG